MQDPEVYLKELGVELPDALDSARPAVLDAAHRARVNHETFFFADLEDRAAFETDPLRGSGWLTDPVSDVRFEPDADSPTTSFGGRRYYFAATESHRLFLDNPAPYADAKREMPADATP